jgi:ribonuclease G
MKKEWFFDRFCGEQIVVYAEDGKIVEVGVENEREKDLVGNIYKGRVANVVHGMQAAFISCGLEKNCYLPLHRGHIQYQVPLSTAVHLRKLRHWYNG